MPVTFDSVHREFRPKVLRYLTRLVGPQEAADLAQLTMLKVSMHLAAFRGDSSLSTWIYRIATNVAMDHRRRAGGAMESLDGMLDDPGEDLPPGLHDDSAESRAARTEMGACVREFLERLPARYQAVLVLSEVEGLQDVELAGALGVSLQAAKIRLHRARASLRRELTQGCTVGTGSDSEVACERRARSR